MELNLNKIKRRYYDLRQGSTTIAPFFQLANFLMLSYLTINEIIPIYLFAPLFLVGIVTTFTLIGAKFRKHQTPTDINMIYEKSTAPAETVVRMMEIEQEILEALGKTATPQFLTRLEYMRKIMRSEL